jgi:hypothetical protein
MIKQKKIKPIMSYRVSKSRAKKPSFLRSTSSFASASRRKPSQSKAKAKAKAESDEDDYSDDKLEDLGLVERLTVDQHLRDVLQAVTYINTHMFDDIPNERSGMNSTRIAEVLHFRKNLPFIVTNAHVHALIDSPTKVEKEIGQLVAEGKVRRIVVPGRGAGSSSISDALVKVDDWIAKIEASDLPNELQSTYNQMPPEMSDRRIEKCITYLHAAPNRLEEIFSKEDLNSLVQSGFATVSSNLGNSGKTFSAQDKELSGTMISLHNIAQAASGSIDAVGGAGAVTGNGGLGGLKIPSSKDNINSNLKLSLPNIGSYLKLVEGARSHLMNLLSKSKYNEAPMYLLRERWNGGVSIKNPYGRSKDPFRLVLPGKTRKWKDFYGLKFEWILAECLGGGLIEVFNTRSVGLGVRAA